MRHLELSRCLILFLSAKIYDSTQRIIKLAYSQLSEFLKDNVSTEIRSGFLLTSN